MAHTIGEPLPIEEPFGDVRDIIMSAPHWGGHGYAMMDLFTVRHEIIRDMTVPPTSVFEFGSLLGYFLLTALDAAPSITRVGWIDAEIDQPGSNMMTHANVFDYFRKHGREPEQVWFNPQQWHSPAFGKADLVQVDAAHRYPDTLTDLIWAWEMEPKTIFVDDYKAIDDVKRATDQFAFWKGLEVEYHETVNGLAVLRVR